MKKERTDKHKGKRHLQQIQPMTFRRRLQETRDNGKKKSAVAAGEKKDDILPAEEKLNDGSFPSEDVEIEETQHFQVLMEKERQPRTPHSATTNFGREE